MNTLAAAKYLLSLDTSGTQPSGGASHQDNDLNESQGHGASENEPPIATTNVQGSFGPHLLVKAHGNVLTNQTNAVGSKLAPTKATAVSPKARPMGVVLAWKHQGAQQTGKSLGFTQAKSSYGDPSALDNAWKAQPAPSPLGKCPTKYVHEEVSKESQATTGKRPSHGIYDDTEQGLPEPPLKKKPVVLVKEIHKLWSGEGEKWHLTGDDRSVNHQSPTSNEKDEIIATELTSANETKHMVGPSVARSDNHSVAALKPSVASDLMRSSDTTFYTTKDHVGGSMNGNLFSTLSETTAEDLSAANNATTADLEDYLECSSCPPESNVKPRSDFSIRQAKMLHDRRCSECTMKPKLKRCSGCGEVKGFGSFSKTQRRRNDQQRCQACVKTKYCRGCNKRLSKLNFSKNQWKKGNDSRECKQCIKAKMPITTLERQCNGCQKILSRDSFLENQWKKADDNRYCKACNVDHVKAEESTALAQLFEGYGSGSDSD